MRLSSNLSNFFSQALLGPSAATGAVAMAGSEATVDATRYRLDDELRARAGQQYAVNGSSRPPTATYYMAPAYEEQLKQKKRQPDKMDIRGRAG